MKYIVMEIHLAYAVVLDENGRFSFSARKDQLAHFGVKLLIHAAKGFVEQ